MIQLDARVIGHIVKDGHRLITHGRQRSVPADAAPDAKRGRRERLAGADGIGEVVPGHDQPLLVDCDGDASLANKPLELISIRHGFAESVLIYLVRGHRHS